MDISFKRSRLVWWTALHAALFGVAAPMAVVAFDTSRALFLFLLWMACTTVAALIHHILILARPKRYRLLLGDDCLELLDPFKTTRVPWVDVTSCTFTGSSDRPKLLRLEFKRGSANRSTRSKSFRLRLQRFDVAPDRLVDAVRSKIDAFRVARRLEPVTIARRWSPEPSHALVAFVLMLGVFARMADREQESQSRHLRRQVGVPGLRLYDSVDKAQVDRLFQLYPRDPRVRLAHAEKLVDDGRIADAVGELRSLDQDQEVLSAFDGRFPRLKGEVRAVIAEAFMKRGRKTEAHEVVGSVCKDLDDRVFEKMRKLDLCHYS